MSRMVSIVSRVVRDPTTRSETVRGCGMRGFGVYCGDLFGDSGCGVSYRIALSAGAELTPVLSWDT
jgi:hypothetical protein